MAAFYNPKTFVGLEIFREEDKIKLKQEKYTKKILKQFEMDMTKSVKIPILKNEEIHQREKITNIEK